MSAYVRPKWEMIRTLSNLKGRIDRIVPSPSGSHIAQIPKLTPVLAVHNTDLRAQFTSIAVPTITPEENSEGESKLPKMLTPEGKQIMVTSPFTQNSDLSYIFNMQNKPTTNMFYQIESLAISDTGNIIALILDNTVWLWQQLEDQYKGVGFWTNLSVNQHFTVTSNDKSPNSPVTYKNLSVFDNPEEGRGACFLTSVLPPSRPFKTIFLFNSICRFKDRYTPTFHRSSVTLPILDGVGQPKHFWSPCCRILVITVANVIIMLTRELDVISVLPLEEVFNTSKDEVAWVSWSSNLQFCILTTMNGQIGAITRSGKSMKHKLCHLKPFDPMKNVPLGVSADPKLPFVFIVYSRTMARYLKVEPTAYSEGVEYLLSLPYPMQQVESLYDKAVSIIRKTGASKSAFDIINMLYYAEVHQIFQSFSPLRYEICEALKRGSSDILRNPDNDALSFFLVRAILRVTDVAVPAFHEVLERLQQSKEPVHRILSRIMKDELEHRDWVNSKKYPDKNIIIYEDEYDEPFDDSDEYVRKPPHHNREVDIDKLQRFVYNALFNPDFDAYESLNVDMKVVMELMLEVGRFDRALELSSFGSVDTNPRSVFARITAMHADDPVAIYSAMLMCLKYDASYDAEIRAMCIHALLNIMRQRVVDTAPNMSLRDEMAVSNLCMMEESIDLPVPLTAEECDDFGVIAGLAMSAAQFPNISLYYNGKSKFIPFELLKYVREIFRLIWFVRWRHASFQELILNDAPGDASLRLLEFPEFVDTNAYRKMVLSAGDSFFTPEILSFYTGPKKDFELDPEFVQFACECAARITAAGLAKVEHAALKFQKDESEIPVSIMVLSTVCSNLVPWLRTGIPRAIVKMECYEIVPNRLIEFEEFHLPPPPTPTLAQTPIEGIDIDEAESILDLSDLGETAEVEIPQQEPPKPIKHEPRPDGDDYLSEGEEDLRPKSKPKEKEKEKDKKSRKGKKSSHEKKHHSSSREKRRERPHLRLINVDLDDNFNAPRLIIPEENEAPRDLPMMGAAGPLPYGSPLMGVPYNPNVGYLPVNHPLPPSYGPIWDIDPMLCQRPYPKPIPDIPLIQEPPTYQKVTQEIQVEELPVQSRTIRVVNDTHADDESSLISEFEILNEGEDNLPPIDPYPLDDALNNRIERLLANSIEVQPMRLKNFDPHYEAPDKE